MMFIMYRITIAGNNYIGHTKNFVQRKRSHKSRCLDVDNKCHHFKIYQTIRENGGWDNCEMVPIEEYECETQLQARIREEQLLKEYNANMNSRNAYTDKQEYINAHKEESKERCKRWYENNKERHAEYRKEYYEANKEKLDQKKKEYREANKEKMKEYNKKYREDKKISLHLI